MKGKLAPILAVVFVVGGGAGLYVASPSLQDPASQLNAIAGARIESAERLLTAYNRDLIRLGELQKRTVGLVTEVLPTTQPDAASLPDGITAEQVSAVAEARPEALDRVNEAVREAFNDPLVRHLTREIEARYEGFISDDLRTEAQQLVPQARVNATPDGLVRLQSELHRALAKNRKRLDAAWREIQTALGFSEGTASGRDHAGVNRMAGIIEYYRAADALRQAQRARLGAIAPRRRLAALALRRTDALADARHVEELKISSVLQTVGERRDAVQTRLKETTARLAALQAEIDQLKKELAKSQQEAADGSAKLLDQETKGYPYDDVQAFEAFREQYLAAGKTWREAVARADGILNGTLNHATIDDPDEYLTRPYEPVAGKEIVVEPGIVFRTKGGEILDARKADLAEQVKTLDGQIEALRSLAQTLDAQRAAALEIAEEQFARIQVEFDRTTTAVSAAQALEEEAINHADKAVRFFKTAATRVQQRAREASGLARSAPPDAPNERLEQIGKDVDFAGHLKASSADALLLVATVHYQQLVDFQQQRVVLGVAEQADVPDVDAGAVDEAIQTAREAGLEAVATALDQLDAASTDLKDQWTITANRAAAAYLGAQLGKETYRKRAEALYATLTADQQDDPLLKPYLNMLSHIRQSQ